MKNLGGFRAVFLGCVAMVLFGIGCIPSSWSLGARDLSPDDLVLAEGTMLEVTPSHAALGDLLQKTHLEPREITLTTFTDDLLRFSWKQSYEEETLASKEARSLAEHAPVGTDVEVPDAVYETLLREGNVGIVGHREGTRFVVPSMWSEGESNFSGSTHAVLLLSKETYEQLQTTRQARVTVGSTQDIFAVVSDYLGYASDLAVSLAQKANVALPDGGATLDEFMTLTADSAWGTYTLTYGEDRVTVPVLIAENMFARYTILARADAPLVLAWEPRGVSWISSVMGTLMPGVLLEGYRITQISQPSEDQQQLQGQ